MKLGKEIFCGKSFSSSFAAGKQKNGRFVFDRHSDFALLFCDGKRNYKGRKFFLDFSRATKLKIIGSGPTMTFVGFCLFSEVVSFSVLDEEIFWMTFAVFCSLSSRFAPQSRQNFAMERFCALHLGQIFVKSDESTGNCIL